LQGRVHDCDEHGGWAAVGAALAVAQAGDHVRLAAGIYRVDRSLSVPSGVSLGGPEPAEVDAAPDVDRLADRSELPTLMIDCVAPALRPGYVTNGQAEALSAKPVKKLEAWVHRNADQLTLIPSEVELSADFNSLLDIPSCDEPSAVRRSIGRAGPSQRGVEGGCSEPVSTRNSAAEMRRTRPSSQIVMPVFASIAICLARAAACRSAP
jgi:hypothetical protein